MYHFVIHHLRDGVEQLLVIHVGVVHPHRQRDRLGDWIKETLTALDLLYALQLHILEAKVAQSLLQRVEDPSLLCIERRSNRRHTLIFLCLDLIRCRTSAGCSKLTLNLTLPFLLTELLTLCFLKNLLRCLQVCLRLTKARRHLSLLLLQPLHAIKFI